MPVHLSLRKGSLWSFLVVSLIECSVLPLIGIMVHMYLDVAFLGVAIVPVVLGSFRAIWTVCLSWHLLDRTRLTALYDTQAIVVTYVSISAALIACYSIFVAAVLWPSSALEFYRRMNIGLACFYMTGGNIYLLFECRKLKKSCVNTYVEQYCKLPDDVLIASSSISCLICLDDFNGKDIVSVLPCKHIFHSKCADEWLCHKMRCPLQCELRLGSHAIKSGEPHEAPVTEVLPWQRQVRDADVSEQDEVDSRSSHAAGPGEEELPGSISDASAAEDEVPSGVPEDTPAAEEEAPVAPAADEDTLEEDAPAPPASEKEPAAEDAAAEDEDEVDSRSSHAAGPGEEELPGSIA